MKKNFLFLLLSINVFCFLDLQANAANDYKKAQMVTDLSIIKHVFEVGYAPLEWKKEYNNWDLDECYEHYKQQILTTPAITIKQFQKIINKFIGCANDYHVGVHFCSTEEATLPFSVKTVEGKYFIDWIDVLRMPPSHYSFRIGDEVIALDDIPVQVVMEELKTGITCSSNKLTDDALLAIKLTNRSGRVADDVPSGAVKITAVSAQSSKEYSYQLIWAYSPEQIIDPFDLIQPIDTIAFFNHRPLLKQKKNFHVMMSSRMQEYIADKQAGHEGGLGAYKSFLPSLGKQLWNNEVIERKSTPVFTSETNDKEEIRMADMDSSFWYAYTYLHENGKVIGYVRIPHYMGGKMQVNEWEQIIQYMEDKTDALVIDQLNNFGGAVEFLYQIASYLSPYPLLTPHHRIKISQEQVVDAYQKLNELQYIDVMFDSKQQMDEYEVDEFFNQYNYQQLIFTKQYCEFLLKEWKAGHLLTYPTPIIGVDMINPHPKCHYSKPILMLINELDFSAGDFLAAILQDNKRATLFGSCTAGAGGYVLNFQFPNNHGIDYFSYTGSLAERGNKQKIEGIGIVPDIVYAMTIEDVQHHYRKYVKAVNDKVDELVQN